MVAGNTSGFKKRKEQRYKLKYGKYGKDPLLVGN
jgi:hypothetical protein